jgi:hypothetical protein
MPATVQPSGQSEAPGASQQALVSLIGSDPPPSTERIDACYGDADQIGSKCSDGTFRRGSPIAAVDTLLNAVEVQTWLVDGLLAAQHDLRSVQDVT